MKRRDIIALLGFLSLSGAALIWRNLTSLWRPSVNEHVAHTVEALADLMYPGDGLPSASEFWLHQRILAKPDLDGFVEGVLWLDQWAALHGAVDFLALDEVGRLAAVDAAFASYDKHARPFVLSLRYDLGTAYYSEPSVKAAFPYTGPPQPDGFADFQDRPA
jgi:hypothetical protein